jgi:hypothetical protein
VHQQEEYIMQIPISLFYQYFLNEYCVKEWRNSNAL